jgi:hypothetical protein
MLIERSFMIRDTNFRRQYRHLNWEDDINEAVEDPDSPLLSFASDSGFSSTRSSVIPNFEAKHIGFTTGLFPEQTQSYENLGPERKKDSGVAA